MQSQDRNEQPQDRNEVRNYNNVERLMLQRNNAAVNNNRQAFNR